MSSKTDRQKNAEKINQVSPSFCLAKWTQVTIDLEHGTNHSCHHPKRHQIPLEELKKDPAALHNTSYKKKQRELMLQGKRPAECSYCWNIEDTKGDHYSDRIIKSLDPWSFPYLEKVLTAGSEKNFSPTYLEVMFDSTCQLACSYCLAPISTSIMKEMKQFGPYRVHMHEHRMYERDSADIDKKNNPYIEAFWKWLPQIWSDLEVLRITGGEPLLSPQTSKLLDWIEKNPNPEVTLAINSNLSLPSHHIDKFLNKVKALRASNSIKVEFYASIDTFGQQAEYIRNGLNSNLFWENILKVLDKSISDQVVLMVTYNILSIPHFDKLISKVVEIKNTGSQLILDMSYLKEPDYLMANMLDEKLLNKVKQDFELMNTPVFNEHEKNKYKRILHWLEQTNRDERIERQMADFFTFINEFDRRYQTNFLSTFPELNDFFIECKKAKFLRL
ncbi:MAG: hypothetical protein Fur0010_22860 [Bdellovibrio sp.]